MATTISKVSDVNASMDIPNHKVNQVIGKRGSAVQAIMEQSGCRVRVDPDTTQDPRRVFISGQPEGISKAMILIQRILQEGPTFLVPLSELELLKSESDVITDDQDVFVPHAKVASLIGAKGVVVGEIMKRTGCKVHIVQEGIADGLDRAVAFTGSLQQIADAKALVRSVIEEGPSVLGPVAVGNSLGNGSTPVNPQVEERDIAPNRVGVVIGSRGLTVRDIMAKSGGCKIYINQNFPEGQPHKIVYTGSPEQISLAMHLVGLVLERGPHALEHIQAPPKSSGSSNSNGASPDLVLRQSQINRLVGPQGAILHGIQSQHLVNISFDPITSSLNLPDPQSRVVIRGHPDGVRGATRTIHAFLGLPEPSLTIAPTTALSAAAAGAPIMFDGFSPYSQVGFALGADGSSGYLETPTRLPDGVYYQIAELKADVSSRIVGRNNQSGSNMLPLIAKKSGAKLQVPRHGQDTTKPLRSGFVRVHIIGDLQSVTLASQMIQEIMVNGSSKLHHMADMPSTVPTNYNLLALMPPVAMSLPVTAYASGGSSGPASAQHGYEYVMLPSQPTLDHMKGSTGHMRNGLQSLNKLSK